ncbi:MAG: dTMP kinase [Desulfoprunum sp.]|jgi:dTMP kinase|uniref:dTMP kinase n=1 Tax=Desulfoprunum sp. TaxID=2020866 RepID=UPI003C77E0B3
MNRTNHPPARGRLIVFEGIDGTGKSTQIRLVADALRQRGYPVVTTREPTDGPYGLKIRALYANRGECSQGEELELFIADRRHHVDELLQPALETGRIILCDRYYLSTAAYQGANGMDVDTILARNRFAPVPDLAILFEAPVALGIERITASRGEHLNDFEKADGLTRVAAIFAALDLPYIRRINAALPIETVRDEILSLILPLLPTPSSAD